MDRKSFLVIVLFFICSTVQILFADEKGRTSVSITANVNVAPNPGTGEVTARPTYQKGELIVQLKLDLMQFPPGSVEEVPMDQVIFLDESFKNLCQSAGVVSIEYLYSRQREKLPDAMKRIYIFRFRDGVEMLNEAAQFQRDPNVEYAEPNYLVTTQTEGAK